MSVRENQLATKISLDWFIGFMEGEGCFVAPRNQMNCEIRVSNTEKDLIDACMSFLTENHILNSLVTSDRGTNKRMYEVYIYSHECWTLYNMVKDRMSCRIDQFQRILGAPTTTRETPLTKEWLSGILEAEGCFTINTQTKKDGVKAHNPSIIVENTNQKITAKIARIYHSLGLAWYTRERNFENPNWKGTLVLTIAGCKRVIRFLNAMKDLWIGDKTVRKVKLLTEYCQSRLNKPPKEPYSSREHEIAHEIKVKI